MGRSQRRRLSRFRRHDGGRHDGRRGPRGGGIGLRRTGSLFGGGGACVGVIRLRGRGLRLDVGGGGLLSRIDRNCCIHIGIRIPIALGHADRGVGELRGAIGLGDRLVLAAAGDILLGGAQGSGGFGLQTRHFPARPQLSGDFHLGPRRGDRLARAVHLTASQHGAGGGDEQCRQAQRPHGG